MNILEEANRIVNERSEEKDRMYGPFGEGMAKATQIFNNASKTAKLQPEDMYLALVALKLSRESYNHKEDNLLDAVAYLGGMNNYINEQNAKETAVSIAPMLNKTPLNFYKTKDVKSPEIGTGGSAGIDFFVPNDFEETVVDPQKDIKINLGIITEFAPGLALIAFNKSGIATKKKLVVGACVVDSDYRGEIHAHMINTGTEPVTITPGMKITQFILIPYYKPTLNELNEKPGDTERGAGGFGSTGA